MDAQLIRPQVRGKFHRDGHGYLAGHGHIPAQADDSRGTLDVYENLGAMVICADRGEARVRGGCARRNPGTDTGGQAVGCVGDPVDEPVTRRLANPPWCRRLVDFGWRDVKQQRGVGESRRVDRRQGAAGRGQLRGKYP